MKRRSTLLPAIAAIAAFVTSSAIAALATGCDSCRTPEPAPPEAASAAAPRPSATVDAASPFKAEAYDGGAGTPPWAAIPSATVASDADAGIQARFDAERKARPAGISPNVESVFAALENAGLVVVDQKQHLGQSAGARYCVGARVVSGKDAGASEQLVISVCEYVSAELAARSRDYSIAALKIIPHRTVHANKQTTMTVSESDPVTPATEAANAKALAAYDAL